MCIRDRPYCKNFKISSYVCIREVPSIKTGDIIIMSMITAFTKQITSLKKIKSILYNIYYLQKIIRFKIVLILVVILQIKYKYHSLPLVYLYVIKEASNI